MKKNKINKRLVLNKTTITDLGNQMGRVMGGATEIIPTVCVSANPDKTCVNTCLSCTCHDCSSPYICTRTQDVDCTVEFCE